MPRSRTEVDALWPSKDSYSHVVRLSIPDVNTPEEATDVIQKCFDGGMAGFFTVQKAEGHSVFVVKFDRDVHDDIEIVNPKMMATDLPLTEALKKQLTDEIMEQSDFEKLGITVLEVSDPEFFNWSDLAIFKK